METIYNHIEKTNKKELKKFLAAKIDGKIVDLNYPYENNKELIIITFEDKEGVDIFRHSSAHLMAHAIMQLYPEAKLTIGPVVDEGFYYDVDIDKPFNPEDLKKIEKKMEELSNNNFTVQKMELSKDEAKKIFSENPYKLELIEELDVISAYKQGDFIDLCKGPHIPSTGYIKAFKLLKIAGAYWRGDSKNKQLQRIYGISFPEKKQLDEYLRFIEEAKKRDHRKLGQDLELFSVDDEAGPGFPFFHPKGMVIWNLLQEFWRQEHTKEGYLEIRTPIILKKDLWVQSGHWDHYRQNMYFTLIDNYEFAIKPMNCPGGILVYKKRPRSYKELPLRIGEMGLVHRHELSGVLAGLFRVRCFTQDDAHIYLTEDQIKDEIKKVIILTDKFYKLFGFNYKVELSTMPESGLGSKEIKEKATSALKSALEEVKIPYQIKEGDGAFYGPKIDFHIEDCLKRTWQCGTIQLDFNLPERFDLKYMAEDGTDKHRPVMIHRTIYGSMERFFGILIEHYGGKFPLWLSPVQVRILTVADRFNDYALQLKSHFEKAGFRTEADTRAESIPKKVREAQLNYIPIIVIAGEKEQNAGTLAVRTLDGKVLFDRKIEEILYKLKEINDKKSLTIEL